MSFEEVVAAVLNRLKEKPDGSIIQVIPRERLNAVYSNPANTMGNIYQNTSHRPMHVYVVLLFQVDDADRYCYARAEVGPASPPTVIVGDEGFLCNMPTDTFLGTLLSTLTFMVPAKAYYRVSNNAVAPNFITLAEWTEVLL